MTKTHLKNHHTRFLIVLTITSFFVSIIHAEETVAEKVVEHGTTIAHNIKDAASDIGTQTVTDATSTLRRIFNLFFDIPEKTVNRFKTAAHRLTRESSFFAHEVRDLGAAIKESAHEFAENAHNLGQRIGQIGANRNRTECTQLALIFTLPSFINPTDITTIKELITHHKTQEILTEGSSNTALELLQSILDLVSKTIKRSADLQLDVAWGIDDDIENSSAIIHHKNNTQIALVLNGALDLSQWEQTVEDVLRIQHYAKKNENGLLLLDAIENLCRKAIHHSIFKSVHFV